MPKRIDLLLINPGNRLEQFAKLHELATVAQPLGIAILAAIARARGLSVEICDAEVEFWTPQQAVDEIVARWDPLVVGISAFTTKMTAAGLILKGVKEKLPGTVTVLGGHHGSAVPERCLREEAVDFVVAGEGFEPVIEIVKRVKEKRLSFDAPGIWYKTGGSITGNGRAAGPENLDELPYAAWDLLPMEKYRAHHWQAWDHNLDQSGYAVIFTSLGCPFACEFCSVNVVYGKRGTRFRSPAHVVGEIKLLIEKYNIKHFEIVDDLFTVNPKRVHAICDEIIAQGLGEKINAWCFGRTNTIEKELVRKMKRAGINWIFMGIESGDEGVLNSIQKKQTLEKIYKANDILRKENIHIGGNFIFGLPEDTRSTMQSTIELACDMNADYSNFFLAMAYPGTSLHELARKKGYPLPEKWGQYGFFAPDAVPLRNEALSVEDILDFRDRAFETYFTGARYQNRVREVFGEHIVTFLKEKVLSKKIHRIHRTEAVPHSAMTVSA